MGDVLGRLLGLADERDAKSEAAPATKINLLPNWWQGPGAKKIAAVVLSEDDWRHLISEHYRDGQWNREMLGPPPDERGCLVPDAVTRKTNLGASA
jgi:hypothetical protein